MAYKNRLFHALMWFALAFGTMTLTACTSGTDVGSVAGTSGTTGGTTDDGTIVTNASLTFTSATPTSISLKGTGTDTSTLIFTLLDASNNALSNQVITFSLSTTLGGISLSTSTTLTNVDGQASVIVYAGDAATPVVVIASYTTNVGIAVTAQSSDLAISTGLADQDSLSLSATTWNPANFNESNGITNTISAYAADHFNNPVPDGTVINLFSECGQLPNTCTTVSGKCTATLTSSAPREADGLCQILAWTVGVESFVDADGDELVDAGEYTNTSAEPWVDGNQNGTWDAWEDFEDYNGNNIYDTVASDTAYNGPLCNETADPNYPGRISTPAGVCSSTKSALIFIQYTMEWSSRTIGTVTSLPDPPTMTCSGIHSNTLIITDENGNSLATGTTVAIAVTDATDRFTVVGGASHTIGNVPKTSFTYQLEGVTATCAAGSQSIIVTVTPSGGSAIVYPFSVTIS